MSTDHIRKTGAGRHSQAGLIVIVLLGVTAAILLSSWIDRHRPPANTAVEEERLYVTGSVARYMSLGFNGLVADWYWMRSLQYVGGKIINAPADVELD